jgi:exonuclease III
MLDDFVHPHDVDIALLQEVTNGDRLVVKVYQSIINVGTLVRGTAILHKLHLQLHKPKRIPTGRGIAAHLGNIYLVNIYDPSGTANRSDRVDFFNTEVEELIPQSPTQLILGGL